ncbi:MAG: ATP-binding protein [bacterium]|nr:ATP-binding protein [bacterium]MDT8367502.1 ATP-binding protein [bacterium]
MSIESHLTDSLVEGLFLFDTKGRLVRVNPSGERILGRSFRSVVNKDAAKVFPGNIELDEMVKACLSETRAMVHSGITMPGPEGKTIDLSVSVSPIQEPDGTLVGTALLVRDETILRDMDRSYRRADQLAIFSVLNLGMAHEIKNPLGGIKGATQLLSSELTPDSPMMEYCEVILREVDRIDGLLETLLAAVPRGELRTSEINIHEILDEVIHLLELSEETAGLSFLRIYDPSLPTLHGDRNGLIQVFLNLLKNSVEASASGGEITIKTQVPVGGPVGTSAAPRSGARGGFLEIVVMDDGQGFDPDIKEYTTFFVTTKSKGVGLGLAISEQIIHDHGGSLVLDNRKEGGAEVRVFLPLKAG